MVRITSDVNWTPGRANKVLGAGVQTSYVHSSKNVVYYYLRCFMDMTLHCRNAVTVSAAVWKTIAVNTSLSTFSMT